MSAVRYAGFMPVSLAFALLVSVSNCAAQEFDLQRDGTAIANGATDNLGANWGVGLTNTIFYRIENNGTSNLTIDTNLPVSNLVNCTLSKPYVSVYSPIPPGASAEQIFYLTPTVAASFSFTITCTNNDANENPYVWNGSGSAVNGAPEMDVSYNSSPLADGAVFTLVETFTAGSATNVTFNIANTGTAVLTVSGGGSTSSGNCTWARTLPGPIQPGTNVNFVLAITPTSAGFFYLNNFLFANNDANENPYNWDMSANAGTPSNPEMDVYYGVSIVPDGGTATYGSGPSAGSPYDFDLPILNIGSTALSITTPVGAPTSLVNCAASITMQPAASVAASSQTSMRVTVTPMAAGAYSCQIAIANNDANENPYNLTLAGTATPVAPEADLQRPVGTSIADGGTDSVGTSLVGTATTFTYSIRNTGNANLTLTLPVPAPGGLTNCSASISTQPSGTTVAPAASVSLAVQVTPSAAGAFSCTVSFNCNDSDEGTYNWTISGTGATSLPEIAIEGFGGVSIASGGAHMLSGNAGIGIGSVHTYTVRNTGNATLNLNGTPTVSFANQVNCTTNLLSVSSTTVAASSFETFNVEYTPIAVGAFSFQVSVANNDPDENPYVYTVSGNAIDPNGGGGGGGDSGGGGCATDEARASLFALLGMLGLLAAALRARRV